MGLRNFTISFENPDAIYYIGQVVRGNVEIDLDAPKKLRGILLKVKGESRVSWMQDEERTNNEGKTERHTQEFNADEEYFKVQFYLLGGSSNATTELPAGRHVYPFTCVLPPTLPSSFEGEHGYIRYTAKAIIDRPWKFDHETKQAFTVLAPYDLNTNHQLRNSVKVRDDKMFCCCWCASGPLAYAMEIEKGGYVPGEFIPVLIDADNISSVKVEKITVEFQKVVTYYSSYPRRETKKIISVIESVTEGPLNAREHKNYRQKITIPSLPPSNLVNCSIIDLDYKLHIVFHVGGCHVNLEGTMPVTIGTVPFTYEKLTLNPVDPPPSYTEAVQNQIGWVQPPEAEDQKPYPHPLKPNYTAYDYGTTDIKDKDDNEHTRVGDATFYPRYPVYPYPSAPPPPSN